MNKKILFTIIPLFILSSCQGVDAFKPYLSEENNLPTIHLDASNHVTYLLLSPFGSIENYEGISTKGKVSEKFYENTVVLNAAAGTLLPDATQVVSSVNGATFRGWAYYDENNENVWPDYYTQVPTANELALKAIFDGAEGEGGGGEPATSITWNITSFPNWLPNSSATVFAWAWGGAAGNGKWYTITLTHDGVDGAYTNVNGSFVAPDNITGFNMARCSAGTVTPNWKATGDNPGRVYNKTGDVTIYSGVTTYASPEWVEYTYNP